jgi:hypothetical protein
MALPLLPYHGETDRAWRKGIGNCSLNSLLKEIGGPFVQLLSD